MRFLVPNPASAATTVRFADVGGVDAESWQQQVRP